MFHEHRAEMARVVESEFGRDLVERPRRMADRHLGDGYAAFEHVLVRRLADRLLKDAREVKRAQAGYGGDIFDRKPLVEVLLDVLLSELQATR